MDTNSTVEGPSRLRRVTGRFFETLGDAATAWRGPQAEPLSENLKGLGRGIAKKPEPPELPEPSPTNSEQSEYSSELLKKVNSLWIKYSERIMASREYFTKFPEIMAPPGWRLVTSSPLDRPRQLHDVLKDIFHDEEAWRRTLSDSDGFLARIHGIVAQLRIFDLQGQPDEDDQVRRKRLEKIMSSADTALADLAKNFEKLVAAAPTYVSGDQ